MTMRTLARGSTIKEVSVTQRFKSTIFNGNRGGETTGKVTGNVTFIKKSRYSPKRLCSKEGTGDVGSTKKRKLSARLLP